MYSIKIWNWSLQFSLNYTPNYSCIVHSKWRSYFKFKRPLYGKLGRNGSFQRDYVLIDWDWVFCKKKHFIFFVPFLSFQFRLYWFGRGNFCSDGNWLQTNLQISVGILLVSIGFAPPNSITVSLLFHSLLSVRTPHFFASTIQFILLCIHRFRWFAASIPEPEAYLAVSRRFPFCFTDKLFTLANKIVLISHRLSG